MGIAEARLTVLLRASPVDADCCGRWIVFENGLQLCMRLAFVKSVSDVCLWIILMTFYVASV
jgi:hypothetical protein